MRMRFEQVVEAPRDALFAFHTDPANLGVLLERWDGFELIAHEHHIRPGARIRLSQRVGPFRYPMVFEHFVLEPSVRFGERQIQGPFARFEHVHEFADVAEGTAIVDSVEFELPAHFGGRLADRLIVAPLLRRFFAFRRSAYADLCRSGRLG